MVIIAYNKKNHRQIIAACVAAMRAGKIVVYPTDTSYGIACDITNRKAVTRFYRIKQRPFNKPVHLIVPSVSFAKSIAVWSKTATQLSNEFWPGPLTLILPLPTENSMELVRRSVNKFSAGTRTIGLRMPNNTVALGLARALAQPIPATSANPSGTLAGGYDSYSAADVLEQFKDKRDKPDIIINAGILPKRKPSTLIRIVKNNIEILRAGPVTKKQISEAVSGKVVSSK